MRWSSASSRWTAGTTNGTVWAVKIVGDTVYIGGDFSLVRSSSGSSQVRNNLAAITISTGVVTSWRADTNSIVYAIDGNSNNLWIGGAFTTIASVSRNRIASVNTATAAVRSGVDPNANGTVRKLHRTGGNVYIGGSFTAIDGTSMRHLVRIATGDGSVDLSWNPNPNHPVTGIDLPSAGDIVYVGGSFTTMGGQPHNYVVGLSPTDASVVTPPYANLTAKAIDLAVTPSGDRVMAGLGGLANRITVWNAATGAQSWRKIMDGDVQAVRYFSGNVYFGFHDAYQGDTNAKLMSADVYTRTPRTVAPGHPDILWRQRRRHHRGRARSRRTLHISGGNPDARRRHLPDARRTPIRYRHRRLTTWWSRRRQQPRSRWAGIRLPTTLQ